MLVSVSQVSLHNTRQLLNPALVIKSKETKNLKRPKLSGHYLACRGSRLKLLGLEKFGPTH